LVVLVIILLFKASKVATRRIPPPNSGIRIIYYEDDTMDHQNLKHRRDSKRWDSRFSESPPTRGSAGAWWLNG
jgi:hypothetical protein